MNRLALIFALTISLGVAHAASTADSEPKPYELGGLSLGMPVEKAVELFPGTDCRSEFEGVTFCTNPDAKISGVSALMYLGVLDGKLVLITFQRIPWKEAYRIGWELQDAFGKPTSVVDDKGQFVWYEKSYYVPHSTWESSPVKMEIIPFGYEDKDERRNYSKLELYNERLRYVNWQPKVQQLKERLAKARG